MNRSRAIRQLCLQVMYMLDVLGEQALADITATVSDSRLLEDHELDLQQVVVDQLSERDRQKALSIAQQAYALREASDALCNRLSSSWPVSRQPVVDRNLIRLGWYEMHIGRIPSAIVINEAVELAKVFCGDRSSAFVNGVLDRMAESAQSAEGPQAAPADPWLADALGPDRSIETAE